MKILRAPFLFATALAGLMTVSRAHWEGTLSDGGTWIIDLREAPIWSPPPLPTFEKFRSSFDTLPTTAASAPIRRIFRADRTFVDFALYLWADTALFGMIYLCVRRSSRDSILHTALCLGAMLTASAVICLLFWLVIGGWGPPLPEFFGGLAILLGLFLAKTTYARERSCQVVTSDRC